MQRRLVGLGCFVLVALALDTRATAEPSITAEPSPQAIVGGEPTEDGEFDDVVEIRAPDGDTCTGVVVTPRVVLTAAHCLDDLRDADTVRVFYGPHDAAFDPVQAIEFGAHPDYDSNAQHVDIHDYGYVLLGSDFVVPGGYVAPIATQDEWDEAMVEGHEVTIVGYGEDGSGVASAGTKRKVTTTIRRFSELGLEFFAGGEELDSCRGDSGGPAYVRMADGSRRLAGIVSRGAEVCGTGGWYGTPYPALCWVDEHTDAGLSDPACNTCDCLDTKPPGDDGCSIAPRDDARSLWLALVLVMLGSRASRRRAVPPVVAAGAARRFRSAIEVARRRFES